ncbi:von willebrand factor type A domain protein (macronuclear) [Tetrahymena thermophila SB210]|uniref:von willebrand factor type A domain protein n=1 Tax=Tetrahymena thermophila (strain SB210) TaxID=312017 RepID=Q24FF3_TETTS|nr:von willebrand factor type A domain protein [Tetrahymena thermophila SB210]EAS06505.1 von willebrand factor type A domain protein [Tetrahymena thermophila SB210]|eukprot:XP_001026750.1 von willebrand factor type A domain protein [Tetrahymena thermophila SB210]
MVKKNTKKTKTIAETIKDSKKILSKNKKPKRQGTMESVANEAAEFLKYTADAHKKRQEEKRELQKKANESLIQRKPKKSKKIEKKPKNEVKSSPVKKTKAAPAAKAKASAKNDAKAVEKKTEKKDKKSVTPVKSTATKAKPASTKKKDAPPVKTSPKKDAPSAAVANKKKPNKQVSNLIAQGLAAGMIDVVFCIDTTGSMNEYLEKTKDTVNKIVEQVKEKSKGESVSVRFGIVAYRDHPPQETTYLTKVQDLCTAEEVLDYIKTLDCQGGGDGAEAVFDGLWEASKNITWRDSKTLPSLRYIFHIGDQPPHGDKYGGYSELWGTSGCPCKIDVNKVAHVINIEQIRYKLIKIGKKLDLMAKEFQEKFTLFEEQPIEDATDMDIKITDMIIRELIPDTDANLDV